MKKLPIQPKSIVLSNLTTRNFPPSQDKSNKRTFEQKLASLYFKTSMKMDIENMDTMASFITKTTSKLNDNPYISEWAVRTMLKIT